MSTDEAVKKFLAEGGKVTKLEKGANSEEIRSKHKGGRFNTGKKS